MIDLNTLKRPLNAATQDSVTHVTALRWEFSDGTVVTLKDDGLQAWFFNFLSMINTFQTLSQQSLARKQEAEKAQAVEDEKKHQLTHAPATTTDRYQAFVAEVKKNMPNHPKGDKQEGDK